MVDINVPIALAHVEEMKKRRENPVGFALEVVSRMPLYKLKTASVQVSSCPDTSNPGGYYHRFVTLEYTGWFGLRWRKNLYRQLTAYDEDDQKAVYARVKGLIEAIKASL